LVNLFESYKNWLVSEKLEDKIEHLRNEAWVKRGVWRRHRTSWDKYVANLEHETYGGLKVYTVLRQISNDIQETAKIHGNVHENVFLQYNEKSWKTTNLN
jgi:hypothetical protein